MIKYKGFEISDDEKNRLREKASMSVRIFQSHLIFINKYFEPEKNIRILEIGCGIYGQIPALFQSHGFAATGIDNFSHRPRMNVLSVPAFLRRKYFYECLNNEAGRQLNIKEVDIRNCDARAMPFQNASFNVVLSSAVFEHISDLHTAVSELNRVLVSGGRASIGIHLFPSLSGCHHPQMWETPVTKLPDHIEPWYHLRGLTGFRPKDLNRYRENHYRKYFSDFFDIEEEIYPHYKEGEQFLTDEILAELKDYSREELLRRWIIFILRKK